MTVHVEVLSLWRGVMRRRVTMAEVVRERGYDLAELRSRGGSAEKRARYRAFVTEALALGESRSALARFLGRSRSAIHKTAQRRPEPQVSR